MPYQRLIEIDDFTRPEHCFLEPDDECYYLGEYESGIGFHSPTNSLILNFKKTPSKRDTVEWQHKEHAIETIANCFAKIIKPDFLQKATLIPIPPSKMKTDSDYDNRMLLLLKAIEQRVGFSLDIRELIYQKVSTNPFHARKSDERMNPGDLVNLYAVNYSLIKPEPSLIFVFDDVITRGCHFKAIKSLLSKHYPHSRIIGLFIARRIHRIMGL